jgi:hypothetical protein
MYGLWYAISHAIVRSKIRGMILRKHASYGSTRYFSSRRAVALSIRGAPSLLAASVTTAAAGIWRGG